MPLPRISRRPSVAATPHWLIQACFPVLLAMVFGGVQVAALWFDGYFLRTNETIAAPPLFTTPVTCSNCGWWPWQDLCNWTKVGDARGIAYSDKRIKDYGIWCVGVEDPPKNLTCECSVQVGTKMYRWLPGVNIGLTPDWGVLKQLGFTIDAEWDFNTTITTGDSASVNFSIGPDTCGPTLYCYTSREYVQSLYKQRLGVKGPPAGGYYNGGWGNTGSTPSPTYRFLVCDSPCSGDFTLFQGPPSAMPSPSPLPDFVGPLKQSCP